MLTLCQGGKRRRLQKVSRKIHALKGQNIIARGHAPGKRIVNNLGSPERAKYAS
jgi:hypothetical protein